jgi:hypothetical protein
MLATAQNPQNVCRMVQVFFTYDDSGYGRITDCEIMSVADKLDETITASLQQSETLRQSILKKEFEGKLV